MSFPKLLDKTFAFFTLSFLLICLTGNAQNIDLLLKGGHVIDPKNGISETMDIAISGKQIIKVAKNIPEKTAKKTIDLKGYYVTPGLIDMHVHVFNGADTDSYIANALTSLPPDGFTFRAGVTTVVDAGSSGWRNFRQFKKQTIDQSQTRVLALLNIVGTGMYGRLEEQDVTDMNPTMTANMISKMFPDILVGIKSAHYWGDFTQVDLAVEAGKLAEVPVMVDFGEHQPPNSIESLFMEHLRPGDIFTHTFSYGPNNRETIVDEDLKVKPFVFEAQKRGINFDVGHGGGAFSFRQAIPAIQQGFLPNVISSDLHSQSMNSGFKDMANLLSKFMSMGLSMEEVVLRATWNPAQVINRKDLGNLDVGAEADIAIFTLREGDFGFLDIRRTKIDGDKRLETEMTIRAGRIVWDLNGLSAPYWESEFK
ncbi:amidohydrolase/deacetylase family metallohydrolase [Cyclobacterium amurskyense]|uniref:Amidohydrolase n=1 Tax=Cyclobacterium amurskyense TaxID=320787 RepID=A0A0H4PSQ8_9BACT|nr:amidohydrolase/deacetylase family metallohydrolase [Cyclobacterium amurskyense]AKP51342.1 Amidohydrolase [Cyclobacterium amurskyense]|tara:strand:- start:9005 stop:10276 length:1272 start_codon:yes stop_codon:yes gene_type:complete